MLRWTASPVAALWVLALAAAVAVPYVVDAPRVQSLIARSAAQALGRPVRLAALSVRVLPLPAVRLKNLEVAEDPRFGTKPFLTMETGSVRLRLLPLLRGHVEFGELVLERPQVALIQSQTGRLNVAPLGARVAFTGRNLVGLGGLASGTSPQLGGSLQGTLTVSGTLGSPRVTGEADFTPLTATQVRAACPEPRRRTLTLDLVRLPVAFADDVLTSRPLTTKLGPGTVTAGLRWNLRDGALLRVSDLSIRALPLGTVLV